MPFAKISKLKDWQDFGFKFKEGNDETKWDDEHGILTFRYTEPMTWWMTMPKEMPRTLEAGWEPVTLARSSDDRVYVERFGSRHFTVFNDSRQQRTVTITLEGKSPASSRELLSGRTISWTDGKAALTLGAEDAMVLELP